MENHANIMQYLMSVRERRTIKLRVVKLSVAELIAELEERRCSTVGDEEILRDRLIRAVIREVEPQNTMVPWYEWDRERLESTSGHRVVVPAGFSGQIPRLPPRSRPVRKNVERRQRSGSDADSSSSDRSPPRRNIPVSVELHQSPPRPFPREFPQVSGSSAVPAAVTTSVITTQARMTDPVRVAVTQSGSAAALGGQLTSRGFGVPRISVREALTAMTFPAAGWAYYSTQRVEERMRERVSPESRMTNTRSENARISNVNQAAPIQTYETPVNRQPAPRDSDRTHWFTPMGDVDGIQGVSDSASEAASQASGLSRAESKAYQQLASSLGRTQENPPRRFNRELSYLSDAGSHRHPERRREESARELGERESDHGIRLPIREKNVRGNREREASDNELFSRPSSADSPRTIYKSLQRPQETFLTSGEESEPRCVPRGRDEGDIGARLNSRSKPRQSQSRPAKSAEQLGHQKVQAVKILRSWGVHFGGEDKTEDPEEFLEQIEDCRAGSGISDDALLAALPCCLKKKATRWFRTIRKEVGTWAEFCRVFRHHFMKVYDREDLLEDLHRRTQAEGEKITSYLASFKYIVSRFRHPPSEREQVELAYRKIHPSYRDAIGDKVIETLDDIERYGRIYERKKDLDLRYLPPPTADKMRVPGAAYTGPRKQKLAALQEEAAASVEATQGGKKGGKGKGKGQAGLQTPNPAIKCEVASEEEKCPDSYAAAVQSGLKREPQRTVLPLSPPQPTRQSFAPDNKPLQQRTPQAVVSGTRPKEVHFARNDRVTDSAGARAKPRSGEFVGACYTCQGVGHRASECPEITCFSCRRKGHTSRECPERAQNRGYRENESRPREFCQICERPGYTVKTCPRCAPLLSNLGNVQRGGQA